MVIIFTAKTFQVDYKNLESKTGAEDIPENNVQSVI